MSMGGIVKNVNRLPNELGSRGTIGKHNGVGGIISSAHFVIPSSIYSASGRSRFRAGKLWCSTVLRCVCTVGLVKPISGIFVHHDLLFF